jgi:hypothetical protein
MSTDTVLATTAARVASLQEVAPERVALRPACIPLALAFPAQAPAAAQEHRGGRY